MAKKEEQAFDYLGNEVKIGDYIVFTHSTHASLALGQVTKIGKNNTVYVNITVAPYAGYWENAIERIGQEVKVKLTKNVEEGSTRREEKEDGTVEFQRLRYSTDYMYALKWTGMLPSKPQYELKRIITD